MRQIQIDQTMKNCETPLISIIVPVYNTAQYLERAVESILRSTYKNLEILLIDDGSFDGSAKICDAYAARESRIRVFHMKMNCGAGSARNKGMELANGEYLAFVDSDDIVEPEMYKTLLHAMMQTDAELAICRFREIYADRIVDDSTGISYIFHGTELFERYVRSDIGIADDDRLFIQGYISNKLYLADVVRKIRFLNGCWEDSLFCTQVFYRVKKAVYIDTAYYNYIRDRIGSMTNENLVSRYSCYCKMAEEKNNFYAGIHRTDLIDFNTCFYQLNSWRNYYAAIDQTEVPYFEKQELKLAVREKFYVHKEQLRDICRKRGIPFYLRIKMRVLLFSPFLYVRLFKIRNFFWRC